MTQKKALWAETSMILHKSSNTDIYQLPVRLGWEDRGGWSGKLKLYKQSRSPSEGKNDFLKISVVVLF